MSSSTSFVQHTLIEFEGILEKKLTFYNFSLVKEEEEEKSRKEIEVYIGNDSKEEKENGKSKDFIMH